MNKEKKQKSGIEKRDTSPIGQYNRKKFGDIQEIMKIEGVSNGESRSEILDMIKVFLNKYSKSKKN